MDADLPSEEEYLNGRMHDGSKPPLFSQKLYREQWSPGGDPFEDQYMAGIPGRQSDEHVFDADRLKVMVLQQELDDHDRAAAVLRRICDTFLERSNEPKAPHDSAGPEAPVASASGRCGSIGVPPMATTETEPANTTPPQRQSQQGGLGSLRIPGIRVPKAPRDSVEADSKTPGDFDPTPVIIPDPPFDPAPEDIARDEKVAAEKRNVTKQILRGPRRRASCAHESLHDLPIEKLTVAATRAATALADIATKRRIVAGLLIDATNKEDVRTAFIRDRAHAVVEGTLLYLDKHFEDVGFGAWMPFRFPDQWLMFCGIMRRILAANGLLHSQHASIYRRLLDETPPVDFDGTIDERIERIVPKNWGKCWRNRGANDMCHLKLRLYFEAPDTS